MALGLDYSSGAPKAADVKAQGYSLVCRYLSHTASKNLTPAERDDMLAHGVDIVLVWETTAARATEGAAAGEQDGVAAKAQAAALGLPSNAAIYFAVDTDTSDLADVRAYLDGAKPKIIPHPLGVYGDYNIVENLVGSDAQYGWQTIAWSHGAVSRKAALFQNGRQVAVDGVTCDLNEIKGPYGGWLDEADPQAAPDPAPQTKDTGEPLLREGDRGQCVGRVQAKIKDVLVPDLAVDDDFGPATKQAVRGFQYVYGLSVDGLVGPQTWHAVDTVGRPPTTKSGDRGDWVKRVQEKVGTKADGIFGKNTVAAVERFQGENGLARDGIVGPKTWAAIAKHA